jgi:potassium-transporting ATPase KdpC subunit
MKQMKTAVLMLLIFTFLTGFIYPLLVTGIGQVFFRNKINGSLIVKNGTVAGSELIGQRFEKAEFFHGRPSAVYYDAARSGGSNMGPTNRKFIEELKNRNAQVRKDFNLSGNVYIPPEMLFASGSGLDPHISVEAAMLQTEKISAARKVDSSVIMDIIKTNTEKQLIFYGNSYVNVLKLNLALNEKGNLK